MKILFFFVTITLVCISCSDWSAEEDKFVNTYRDILAIRLMFPDTAIANPKINKIYTRNNYTAEQFKSDFVRFSQKPEKFRTMIDSARERARREYIRIEGDSLHQFE